MTLSKSYIALIAICSALLLCIITGTLIYYLADPWTTVYVQPEKSAGKSRLLNTKTTVLKPTVLHLVLWSDSPAYNSMKEITAPYYQQFEPRVKTLYYAFDPSVGQPVFTRTGLLLLPGKECFKPCILLKTLRAFEFTLSMSYDFLVRSNVSTVVNWNVLLNLLAAYPSLHYGGGNVKIAFDNYGMLFVQGTSIVLSKDAVRYILANGHNMRLDLQDDLAIAKLIKAAPFVNKTLYKMNACFKVASGNYVPSSKDVMRTAFFRNKSGKHRERDVARMRKIVSSLAPAEVV